MHFYTRRLNKVAGPFTSDQLAQLRASGMLEPTDLVSTDDRRSWVVASKVALPVATATAIGPATSGSGPRGSQRYVLTELTSKRYKLAMLVGVVLWIGGCASYVTRAPYEDGKLSATAFGAGVVTFFAAKFLAWWNHG